MKTALMGLGSLLGVVVIVASFLGYAGTPPYASQVDLAGLSVQVYEDRAYRLQRNIWDLEDRKRKMIERNQHQRREWFERYERQLLEARRQLKILRARIEHIQRWGK